MHSDLSGTFLDLAEIRKYRVDQLESLVDLLADFSTSQDNLATDEDQENDLGLHHAIDQTREQLRLVGTEVVVTRGQPLQTDGELDVARADDVLDLEIGKLGVETKLLDNTRILARSQLRIILGLGTSDDHLARGEDKSGGLGLANSHDDGSKTLWVVLGVTRVQGNRLQIQAAIKVDRCDDVLQSRRDTTGALVGSRCSSRSCGGNRSADCALLAVQNGSLNILWVAQRRCKLLGSPGERQRPRRSEGLGLSGVGRMRLNAFHDWVRYR
jgi:hypothetical protein